MFSKLNRPIRIYQQVAEEIENAILSGDLNPGDKLASERELSKTFGVGQRTLREALRLLEEKGLIETNQTGNVVKITTSDVITQNLTLLIKLGKVSWGNLLQFRLDLDRAVSALAAELATTQDLNALETLVIDARSLFESGKLDLNGFMDIDREFHLRLARITGNPMYEWVLMTVIDNFFAYYRKVITREREFVGPNLQSYVAILQALSKGDADEARFAAEKHMLLGNTLMSELGLSDQPMARESANLASSGSACS